MAGLAVRVKAVPDKEGANRVPIGLVQMLNQENFSQDCQTGMGIFVWQPWMMKVRIECLRMAAIDSRPPQAVAVVWNETDVSHF